MHFACGSVCTGLHLPGGGGLSVSIIHRFSMFMSLVFLDPGGSYFNHGQHFTLPPEISLLEC